MGNEQTGMGALVGAYVEKVGGDYKFAGTVRAQFQKASGVTRYVVEDERGLLFIFNPAQINLATRPVAAAPASPAPDRMREALEEITTACEADCTSEATALDADDEPVGLSDAGPTTLTFGMIRRARAALASEPEPSPCKTCSGKGHVAGYADEERPNAETCPDCGGSGEPSPSGGAESGEAHPANGLWPPYRPAVIRLQDAGLYEFVTRDCPAIHLRQDDGAYDLILDMETREPIGVSWPIPAPAPDIAAAERRGAEAMREAAAKIAERYITAPDPYDHSKGTRIPSNIAEDIRDLVLPEPVQPTKGGDAPVPDSSTRRRLDGTEANQPGSSEAPAPSPSPDRGADVERRQGHSKLVYNKTTRSIDTINTRAADEKAARKIVGRHYTVCISPNGPSLFADITAALSLARSEERKAVVAENCAQPLMGKYGDVLRPFLAMMEAELHANSGKGDRPGWLAMDRKTGLLEIFYHLAKLQKAVKHDDETGIREYAADVANMAMMLVDICGALSSGDHLRTAGER